MRAIHFVSWVLLKVYLICIVRTKELSFIKATEQLRWNFADTIFRLINQTRLLWACLVITYHSYLHLSHGIEIIDSFKWNSPESICDLLNNTRSHLSSPVRTTKPTRENTLQNSNLSKSSEAKSNIKIKWQTEFSQYGITFSIITSSQRQRDPQFDQLSAAYYDRLKRDFAKQDINCSYICDAKGIAALRHRTRELVTYNMQHCIVRKRSPLRLNYSPGCSFNDELFVSWCANIYLTSDTCICLNETKVLARIRTNIPVNDLPKI